jgi:hypothetical protein
MLKFVIVLHPVAPGCTRFDPQTLQTIQTPPHMAIVK